MIKPLPEDSAIVFKLIKSHSGISGKALILETGFEQDKCIDALKELVLRNLVYTDFLNPRDFIQCRFYPKV